MSHQLLQIITAAGGSELRDASLDVVCRNMSAAQLGAESQALDAFRRSCPNLYQLVRALFFLYAIHRFQLPPLLGNAAAGLIPFDGYKHVLSRRFDEAIDVFLAHQKQHGQSDSISTPWRRLIKSWRFKPWPIRCGRVCAA